MLAFKQNTVLIEMFCAHIIIIISLVEKVK